MTDETPAPSEIQRTRERMEKLSWLLDDSVPIPGTRFRFGLDSIIGLVPGLGDVVGVVLGAGILYQSVRIGAPRAIIIKMVGNSATDAIGGLVPMIGDLFDFAFKSNRRNAKLLMDYLDAQEAPELASGRSARFKALALSGAFLAVTIGLIAFAWHLILSTTSVD